MGSMVLSTCMMFVPQHVEILFLAIVCIGFFGIYVPYNESRKRGEIWGPLRRLKGIKALIGPARRDGTSGTGRAPAMDPDRRRRLEQLKSMKEAGLIDGREYRRRRDEIVKEL